MFYRESDLELNDKFLKFRAEQALTQEQLAKKLEVSKGLIAAIEQNQRAVSMKMVNKIKEIFGVDIFQSGDAVKLPSNIISIPFYPVKAAAGEGTEVPEYAEKDVLHFDKRWLQAVVGHNPEHLSLIRAEGDSMLPDIQDGDLLMVDDSIREVIPNKTFVIKQDDKYRVKKLKAEFTGEILIISNNPNYPVEVMNKETEIIGQVVWNGSKESV